MRNGLIIDNLGTKRWYKNDQYHRENGPAIEYTNGYKFWLQNGLRHRIDGPAIEYINGYKEWYYKGKFINCKTNEEFLRLIKLRLFW